MRRRTAARRVLGLLAFAAHLWLTAFAVSHPQDILEMGGIFDEADGDGIVLAAMALLAIAVPAVVLEFGPALAGRLPRDPKASVVRLASIRPYAPRAPPAA